MDNLMNKMKHVTSRKPKEVFKRSILVDKPEKESPIMKCGVNRTLFNGLLVIGLIVGSVAYYVFYNGFG